MPAGAARLAARPQPEQSNLAHERHIGALKPETQDLPVEHRPVDMGIVGKARRQILTKRFHAARHRLTRARGLTQVLADRLAVTAGVSGDRRYRPAPARQGVDLHIVLLCQHPQCPFQVSQASTPATLEGAPDRTARGSLLRSGLRPLAPASYRAGDIRGGEFSRSDVGTIPRSPTGSTVREKLVIRRTNVRGIRTSPEPGRFPAAQTRAAETTKARVAPGSAPYSLSSVDPTTGTPGPVPDDQWVRVTVRVAGAGGRAAHTDGEHRPVLVAARTGRRIGRCCLRHRGRHQGVLRRLSIPSRWCGGLPVAQSGHHCLPERRPWRFTAPGFAGMCWRRTHECTALH